MGGIRDFLLDRESVSEPGKKILIRNSDSTVCLRSLEPFYIVTYYMNWAKTSWTYSMQLCKVHAWQKMSAGRQVSQKH